MFEYAFLVHTNYEPPSAAEIFLDIEKNKAPNEWEFDRTKKDDWKGSSLRFVLNELGREGWELVCKDVVNAYIFKRKVSVK